jgi:hypothetical protein
MTKLCFAVALIALAVLATSTGADAITPSSHGGYCPAGTCADNGGKHALHLSHCKASNCQRRSKSGH